MSPRPPGRPLGPDRRTIVRAGAWSLAALAIGGGTSACGIHLEDHAPPVPLVPTRTVDARARAVYDELVVVRTALASASAPPSALAGPAAALAALHRTQAGVLDARLRELGEDPEDASRLAASAAPSSAPSSTSTATGSPTTTGRPTATAPLPTAEAAGLDAAALARLDRLPAPELPLLLSLRIQRAVASSLLGVPAPAWPAGSTAPPEQTARWLAAARSAEYGLGVAAARATDPASATVRLAWTELVRQRRILEQLPGGGAQPAPGGYVLPEAAGDGAAAARLAVVVLQRYVGSLLAGASEAAGHPDALASLLGWATAAELLATRLGAPLRAFPGLDER